MVLSSAFRRSAVAVVVGMALLILAGVSQAQPGAADAAQSETISEQTFAAWLAALREEARGKGISEATLNAALGTVAPLARVVEFDRKQPEFTQTFWTYFRRRVTDERIERGRALLVTHRDLLLRIHSQYGVPPRYLIALWGLESNFGDRMGSFRVIDALATLAYDQRRPRFFRNELFEALRIVEEGHIAPDAMLGSWAGAMGHIQFIPSAFVRHAVDFSGDGRKDIWGTLPDALASAANFLANLGWRSGEIWGREVRLPRNFDLMLASLEVRKSTAQWAALGVRRADGSALPRADVEGSIVLPQGHKGPAFLVYDNFRVIMRWNRSVNYAISVGHLSDRIFGLPAVANGLDAEHAPLSMEEVKEMQQLLNRLGFEAGAEDGVQGAGTRTAIRAFQQKHALPPDGYATPALLKRLRESAPHQGQDPLR